MKVALLLLVFLVSTSFLNRALVPQATDPLMDIMVQELNREMSELAKAPQPPYYMSYSVTDVQTLLIGSSFGSLTLLNPDRSRRLAADVRVGDYKLDNSHPVEDDDGRGFPFEEMMMGGYDEINLPLDNRPEAIKLTMWQLTKGVHRQAANSFRSIRSSQKQGKSSADDFSREQPGVYEDSPLPELSTFISEQEWIAKTKKLSALFLASENIVRGDVSVSTSLERKYFLSTEGSRVIQNRTSVYLSVDGSVRADDGDVIPLYLSYFAFDAAHLPAMESIEADIRDMIAKLIRLRSAPVAEPYTGPAILHANAAGVFFHEIFGHRIEGHRLKSKYDGQTFKAKLNEQVLPTTLTVISDPTLRDFNGQALNGHYLYDDEGVKGQRVTIVEKGILKSFLMSRTPLEGMSSSNGHGRAQFGSNPVSRQSNLIIQSKKAVSSNDLRKMLISECKRQKKPYGYFFKEVTGGFTMTQRTMPNAFNIFPTEVYRVYVDGRADELVRGVDLIGTPLLMFAGIEASDDKSAVFTGFCGAESGSVPVTATSPSLFVKRIETQKKSVVDIDKPILNRPTGN